MADAEFGDAVLSTQEKWFYRTIHWQCRRYLYAGAAVTVLYLVMLWNTDMMWPTFPLSMLHAAALVAGIYAMHMVGLYRNHSKPGLYERGLVSVHQERAAYTDVYRIELWRDNVHVLYESPDDDSEDETYAFFPIKFLTNEGLEMVRIKADQYH